MKLCKKKELFQLQSGSKSNFNITDVLLWLENEFKVPASLMLEIRLHISKEEEVKKNGHKLNNYSLAEHEAHLKVESFNFQPSSFLKYCIENEKALKLSNGTVLYDPTFIDLLQENYISQNEALKFLYISPKTIYNNSDFFGRIAIGKIIVVSRKAVYKYKESGLLEGA
jgi:hypothetical protein